MKENFQTIENLEVISKGVLQRSMVSRAVFEIIPPDLMTQLVTRHPVNFELKNWSKAGWLPSDKWRCHFEKGPM